MKEILKNLKFTIWDAFAFIPLILFYFAFYYNVIFLFKIYPPTSFINFLPLAFALSAFISSISCFKTNRRKTGLAEIILGCFLLIFVFDEKLDKDIFIPQSGQEFHIYIQNNTDQVLEELKYYTVITELIKQYEEDNIFTIEEYRDVNRKLDDWVEGKNIYLLSLLVSSLKTFISQKLIESERNEQDRHLIIEELKKVEKSLNGLYSFDIDMHLKADWFFQYKFFWGVMTNRRVNKIKETYEKINDNPDIWIENNLDMPFSLLAFGSFNDVIDKDPFITNSFFFGRSSFTGLRFISEQHQNFKNMIQAYEDGRYLEYKEELLSKNETVSANK